MSERADPRLRCPVDATPAIGSVGADYRAQCPKCGRQIKITKRGLFAPHNATLGTARWRRLDNTATTDGPWALRGYQIRARNGAGAHVATWQICEADGWLLAAAPDLRAALRELVDYAHIVADGGGTLGTLRDLARAATVALDKARGGKP